MKFEKLDGQRGERIFSARCPALHRSAGFCAVWHSFLGAEGRFYIHFAKSCPGNHFETCKVGRDMVKYTYHTEAGTTIMSKNHQKSHEWAGTAAFFTAGGSLSVCGFGETAPDGEINSQLA